MVGESETSVRGYRRADGILSIELAEETARTEVNSWGVETACLVLRRLALAPIGDGVPKVETVEAGVGTETDSTDVEMTEGY